MLFYAATTTTIKTSAANDWRVPVTLLGVMTIGAYGIVIYGFAAFISPIRDDTGWSNSQISAAFSLSALLSGFGAIATGRWLDRVGARPVTATTLAIGAALLWVASTATSVLWFVIAWGFGGGVIGAGLFYNTTMATTTRLVPFRRRATAFTWLTVIGGLSAPITFPLAGWLVETWGWRDAMRAMIAFLVVTALPAVIFVGGGASPEASGPAPSGGRDDGELSGFADVKSALGSAAVRRWLIAVAASMASLVAVQVHHVPAMQATGLTLGAATTLAGIRGLLSLPGRAAVSPFVTRLGTVAALRLNYALLAVGALALAMAGPGVMVWAFVVLTGLSFGTIAPLQGLYAADLYGSQRIGTLMGMQQMVLAVATAIGPLLAGVIIDATGGYALFLILAVGLNIVALAIFAGAVTSEP